MSYITSYCHISLNSYAINGEVKQTFNAETIDSFTKELYKHLAIEYPKFYKMDRLTKTAFLGAELLKKNFLTLTKFKDDDIALLFANNNSSALTDVKFTSSYQDGGNPSPSLFVYTLPNILIGEIAIRNKWYGENMFTVSENFDAEYFTNYSKFLLNKNAEAVLIGWLNVNDTNVEAFLAFITKKDLKQLNLELNSKQLLELFRSNKNE